MNQFQIIPAIDLSEGRCIRLKKGDFAEKTVYDYDPVELAKLFEANGMQKLHLVDLDGARLGRPGNFAVLERICAETDLEVDFGGGLRDGEMVGKAFSLGAKQVTVGSVAVRQPEVFRSWLEKWGAERFILGADARKGKIAVAGWQEGTEMELVDFIGKYRDEGVRTILCTAIERDGMLAGPDFKLYEKLHRQFPDMEIIASGGVAEIGDLDRLADIGIYGSVVGKAFFEGHISIEQMAERC